MTQKNNRLATIEALYASRETAAGRQLIEMEHALANAKEQKELLLSARDEQCTPSGSLGIGGLQNRAAFLRKLDLALAQQDDVIRRAQLDRDALHQSFVACRQRTMAVGKANARRLAAQRSAAERRDQKEQDAWRAPITNRDNSDA